MSALDSRNVVPCGTCTLCCWFDLTLIEPAEQAREHYRVREVVVPELGTVLALERKADGSCTYLTEAGCAIWDRAPRTCRDFDCRLWAQQLDALPRPQRRRLLAKSALKRAVIAAGRERAKTLDSG